MYYGITLSRNFAIVNDIDVQTTLQNYSLSQSDFAKPWKHFLTAEYLDSNMVSLVFYTTTPLKTILCYTKYCSDVLIKNIVDTLLCLYHKS